MGDLLCAVAKAPQKRDGTKMGLGGLQNGTAFSKSDAVSNGVVMRRDQTKDVKRKLKIKKKTKPQR